VFLGISPRCGAKKSSGDALDGFLAYRNQAISIIEKLGGDKTTRKEWEKRALYHKRSFVETQFFRPKTIFGANLRSRMFDNQSVESFVRRAALKMTGLGMPQSYTQNTSNVPPNFATSATILKSLKQFICEAAYGRCKSLQRKPVSGDAKSKRSGYV
jgi:hypothetical protein